MSICVSVTCKDTRESVRAFMRSCCHSLSLVLASFCTISWLRDIDEHMRLGDTHGCKDMAPCLVPIRMSTTG